MAKPTHGSTKRALITKANKRIVVATSIATFVFIFSAVAANSLVRQMMYQERVIGERKNSLKVAQDSLAATEDLKVAYEAFTSTSTNVLGGNPAGAGDRDGDNAKIILDALPARYDYPALASSIEKLVNTHGLQFTNMTGNDDTIAQQDNVTSAAPQPIEMPFDFSVSGSYESTRALLLDLERSIRPFKVSQTEIIALGEGGELTLKVTGATYFQPAKNLNVTEEVVQ